MQEQRAGSYLKWVYMAYGFYFLLGLAWLIVSLTKGGRFNFVAFFIIVVFGSQFYYKHLITNLVLGVISMFVSIYMLLEAVNIVGTAAQHRHIELFDKVLVAIPVVSLLMAGVLVFSYLKLNFSRE